MLHIQFRPNYFSTSFDLSFFDQTFTTWLYVAALNAGAKRSDVPYGHASMLLLGEGSEATEPNNEYANLFKYMLVDQFDQPIWSTLLSPM